jgi:hypothetical protein
VRVDLPAGRAPHGVEVEQGDLARDGVCREVGNVLAFTAELDEVSARRQRRQRIERQIGMALEALRLGTTVYGAPILGRFELRDERRIAAGADLPRHAVLAAGRARGRRRAQRRDGAVLDR